MHNKKLSVSFLFVGACFVLGFLLIAVFLLLNQNSHIFCYIIKNPRSCDFVDFIKVKLNELPELLSCRLPSISPYCR